MIVHSRFDVPEPEAAAFQPEAEAALAALAGRPGFLRGRLGRSPDDPTVWVLATEWTGVGAYRRSLSAYDVKVHAAPLLGRARDEVSAFEILHALDESGPVPTTRSGRAPDAATIGIGEAAGPGVTPPPAR